MPIHNLFLSDILPSGKQQSVNLKENVNPSTGSILSGGGGHAPLDPELPGGESTPCKKGKEALSKGASRAGPGGGSSPNLTPREKLRPIRTAGQGRATAKDGLASPLASHPAGKQDHFFMNDSELNLLRNIP